MTEISTLGQMGISKKIRILILSQIQVDIKTLDIGMCREALHNSAITSKS
jgi:hypothetical protein